MENTDLIEVFKKLPEGEWVELLAMSSSMSPMIKPKDRLRLTKVKLRKIKVGEVVAYVSNIYRKIVVHRVVKKGWLGQLEVKGDQAVQNDKEKVTGRNFLGKVSLVKKEKDQKQRSGS